MSSQIVECIPNFSTSNENDVKKLLESIESSGIKILDHTSDIDHNRTVITFIGSPDAVLKSAFNMVKVAAELIDLTTQTGVHPRIGATDVLPLVPVKNISFEECIELAKKLGKKIGEELKIPIYLYEKATTREEFKNLANLRKPNTLKSKPDFGPHSFGTAGATCLGVRDFLIAYNINLATPNIEIAKKIANQIRESNGGLPGVKALGLYLKDLNCAQVSMNLVDYKKTNISDAYAAIEKLAKEYGTEIRNEELIGLTPNQVFEQLV